ncbi:MAG TPA: hypothetical protein VH186_38930 [Chloroflexia bacterium]|nr:hypothetical protein [Chloroflexia bacterium]
MKTYHVSTAGRVRAAAVLVTLALIFLYSARKALGLWTAVAKPSDPYLFNLNLNTTIPAILLTLVALGCAGVAWYVVMELLSKVRVDESGILLHAPGYRLFYRWNEVTGVDVLNGPEEDAAACLSVEVNTGQATNEAGENAPVTTKPSAEKDEIAAYLSEADLREDRKVRQQQQQVRRQQLAQVRARATRPDGRALPVWMRLLYPQARHPDRILLYPSLDERVELITEIEKHLARV